MMASKFEVSSGLDVNENAMTLHEFIEATLSRNEYDIVIVDGARDIIFSIDDNQQITFSSTVCDCQVRLYQFRGIYNVRGYHNTPDPKILSWDGKPIKSISFNDSHGKNYIYLSSEAH